MIRFVGNFILFGLLFFIIWKFFPDAFNTLVHWASQTVDFIHEQALRLYEAIQGTGRETVQPH